MRCPRSVKKRMLLAEVAPMSSTHIASSDLKLRASSAMALDRRFSRSCLFGSDDAAGVLLLRKNLISMVWTFTLGRRCVSPPRPEYRARSAYTACRHCGTQVEPRVAQYNLT